MQVYALLLLAASVVLLWQNRPQGLVNAPASEMDTDSGSRFAFFACGLMFIAASLMSLFLMLPVTFVSSPDVRHAWQLLMQLAFYAALPLLVITGVAKAWSLHWSRQTFGRLFLAVCAVFALLRGSLWLEYWLWLVLAVGLAGFVRTLIANKSLYYAVPALIWLMACAGYQQLDTGTLVKSVSHLGWLTLCLLPYLLCRRDESEAE